MYMIEVNVCVKLINTTNYKIKLKYLKIVKIYIFLHE